MATYQSQSLQRWVNTTAPTKRKDARGERGGGGGLRRAAWKSRPTRERRGGRQNQHRERVERHTQKGARDQSRTSSSTSITERGRLNERLKRAPTTTATNMDWAWITKGSGNRRRPADPAPGVAAFERRYHERGR